MKINVLFSLNIYIFKYLNYVYKFLKSTHNVWSVSLNSSTLLLYFLLISSVFSPTCCLVMLPSLNCKLRCCLSWVCCSFNSTNSIFNCLTLSCSCSNIGRIFSIKLRCKSLGSCFGGFQFRYPNACNSSLITFIFLSNCSNNVLYSGNISCKIAPRTPLILSRCKFCSKVFLWS